MKDPMEAGRLLGQWLQIVCALNALRLIGAWATDGGHMAKA